MSDTRNQIDRTVKVCTSLPTSSKVGQLHYLTTTNKLYITKSANTFTEIGDATQTDSAQVFASLLQTQQQFAGSSGTAYTLTNSSAAVVFGTTSPTITLTAAGQYLLIARCRVEHAGATYGSSQLISVTVERTNNTPAAVTGASMFLNTGVRTTITETAGNLMSFAPYTGTVGDVVTLKALVAATPSAGSTTISQAVLIAIRLS